ncbi:hypothetical protein [Baaleninema sp.]|uniref:hypothetical protein n=1 Tax=Baaleninema sp. TaxID=3101197 RepID=UPI003D02CF72
MNPYLTPESYVNPPEYTVIILSCTFAILCGIIFKDILEYQFARWNAEGQPPQLNYKTPHLTVAYVLTCLFTLAFVGASLSVFGIFTQLAYILAAVVVVPTGLLVWLQLSSMLALVAKEGIRSIVIDE